VLPVPVNRPAWRAPAGAPVAWSMPVLVALPVFGLLDQFLTHVTVRSVDLR